MMADVTERTDIHRAVLPGHSGIRVIISVMHHVSCITDGIMPKELCIIIGIMHTAPCIANDIIQRGSRIIADTVHTGNVLRL